MTSSTHDPLGPVARLALIVAVALLPAGALRATTFEIDIDTSALAGAAADLALDLLDGGSPSNEVAISDFATDGGLVGSPVTTGGVSGAFPGAATLSDTSFFNEILQSLTLGSSISFHMTPTQHGPLGLTPDAFSVFLLSPATGLPLFSTSDPTGADALLLFEITGSSAGRATAYAATTGPSALLTIAVVAPPPGAVPLAPTSLLVSAGLGVMVLVRLRRPKSGAAAR